jgi:hypothetical protein
LVLLLKSNQNTGKIPHYSGHSAGAERVQDKEAIEVYIEVLKERGELIPDTFHK